MSICWSALTMFPLRLAIVPLEIGDTISQLFAVIDVMCRLIPCTARYGNSLLLNTYINGKYHFWQHSTVLLVDCLSSCRVIHDIINIQVILQYDTASGQVTNCKAVRSCRPQRALLSPKQLGDQKKPLVKTDQPQKSTVSLNWVLQ